MAPSDEVNAAIWSALVRFGLQDYADALTDLLEGFGEFEDDEVEDE